MGDVTAVAPGLIMIFAIYQSLSDHQNPSAERNKIRRLPPLSIYKICISCKDQRAAIHKYRNGDKRLLAVIKDSCDRKYQADYRFKTTLNPIYATIENPKLCSNQERDARIKTV
jgi:hypothetical protein